MKRIAGVVGAVTGAAVFTIWWTRKSITRAVRSAWSN